MTDTAKRLAGPVLLTNAAVTRYTVPGATTAILRHLHVVNTSGTAATFFLSIGADAAGTRLWSGVSIPANGELDWSGFLVLAATEIIQAYSGTTSVLTLTVSGAEVT